MQGGTIFALASAPGPAGIAVVRLSGPETAEALIALTGADLPEPRYAARARLKDEAGQLLDDALVLWFPGPASFTGEDVAELHLHGGRAVLVAVFAVLGRMPGLRLAQPGEFSRRAFENGKLDLTQAEAIADLVAAETEAQRRQSLRQMQGALRDLYEDWRARLIRAMAHSEAEIDFADEDLPAGLSEEARARVGELHDEIALHLADGHRGERLRDGISIVILGAPNVGKSSLLNALAKREAAIVSDTAGTTRDVIEVHLDLGGYPAILADTAGLREASDAIESEGVRRALKRAEAADLKLVLIDASAWPAIPPETAALIDDDALVIVNKADRAELPPDADASGQPMLPISVKTGQGMAALLAALEGAVADRVGNAAEAAFLTRQRHREALDEALLALERYLANEAIEPELAAEDLRLAARALGRITGRVDVEDLLDVIFRDFCIGK